MRIKPKDTLNLLFKIMISIFDVNAIACHLIILNEILKGSPRVFNHLNITNLRAHRMVNPDTDLSPSHFPTPLMSAIDNKSQIPPSAGPLRVVSKNMLTLSQGVKDGTRAPFESKHHKIVQVRALVGISSEVVPVPILEQYLHHP